MKKTAILLYLLSVSLGMADPVILEFLASNDDGLKDENGDNSDWIEIHNPDASSVSLSGWSLSDDLNLPTKWSFPSVTLAPNEKLVVFASGKDRAVAGSELHTNFSLSTTGEYLALVKPDGSKTSEFNPYPAQETDVSYGLVSNTTTVVDRSSSLSYVLSAPANDAQGDAWTEDDYDDSSWSTNGVTSIVVGTTTPVNIVDLQTATSPITVSGLSGTIVDVNVTLDINHTWNSDVDVHLRAPDGTLIELFTDVGGSSNNFTNTKLDDQAGSGIASSSAPFTGTFQPEGSLSAFNGKNPNGVWTLEVTDDEAGITGVLNSWSIELTPSASSQAAHGSIGYDNSSEYDIDTVIAPGAAELWVRYPFTLASIQQLNALTLRTKHDDGFQAYLNGVLIHSTNVTATIQSIEALSTYTDVDLAAHLSLLKVGGNVLTFRVVNTSATSSDLLIDPELVIGSNSTSVYRYSPVPTPGSSNLQQTFLGSVADTKFTVGRGFYTSAFNEIVTCATPGATIVYTTDGSDPSASNGTQVAAPNPSTPPTATIPVSRTMPIRTTAFLADYIPTNSDTNTYIFPVDVKGQTSAITQSTYGLPSSWNGVTPDYGMDTRVVGPSDQFSGVYAQSIESDLKAIPSLSIVMNQEDLFGANGIYSNPLQSGAAWERATSLELIHSDGTKGFQENCGLRIQGGFFRSLSATKKKSFRVLFKKEYGKGKLSHDFFGDGATKEFNSIVLRMMSNDSWNLNVTVNDGLFVRDAFGRRVQRSLGQTASHSNWMHLYINGVYWGLYHPVERPDSSFAESYFDVPEEEWDGLNSGNATNASGDPDRTARAVTAWSTLKTLADVVRSASGDSAKHTAYMKLLGMNADGSNNGAFENYLDVDNYIDYLIVNHYGANRDWPNKNYYCGRHNSPESTGFKFFSWDHEWTMDYDSNSSIIGRSSVSHNNVNVYTGVAEPYGDLINSNAFKIRFADRIHAAMFNGAILDGSNPVNLFTELTETIRRPLVGESARWGDQHTSTPLTVNAEWQTKVSSLLTNWLPNRSGNLLTYYRAAGLYPVTAAPVFNQHGGSIASGFQLTMTNPGGSGTLYYTTNGTDPLQINSDGSFSVSGSALTYSSAVTVSSNITVKSRVLNGGVWSALNEADFALGSTPSLMSLVISEFSYQPAESAVDAADGDDFEFIEIMNISSDAIDLTSLEFDQGITFDFATIPLSERTLAAGARAVIVEDKSSFQSRYGTSITVLGKWVGKLSNSGESIRLRIKGGSTVQEFTYNDKAPWPTCADGDGYSLVLVDPTSSPVHNDAASWRCSVQKNGVPGGSDAIAAFSGSVSADNDFDGLNALLEHFLGSADSDVNSGNNLLSTGVVEIPDVVTTKHLTYTFRRKLGQDDLSYNVEVSTTLQSSSWQSGTAQSILMSQVHNGDGTVTETWRSVASFADEKKLFMRLKVTN